MIKTDFKQENFIIYELILPYCTVCTPANGFGENQWHTPVTCEESSDASYSLFFTSNSAPYPMQQPSPSFPGVFSKLNSKVFNVVTSATSSTAKIKPGEGLASRSTISVSMEDFSGDPGPINFSENGTFFGKLRARNILTGKKIISHYYSRLNPTSAIEEVSTETHFIESTDLTSGKFTLTGKDALKNIEALSDKFPPPSDIELVDDIDAVVTSFEISDASTLAIGDVIRIDDELMRLNAEPVGNVISTYDRGQGFSSDGQIIYKTEVDSHSAESTVQPCYAMFGYYTYDVLLELFVSAGLGSYTNYSQWVAEIDEWISGAKLYGVMHTPESYGDIINSILSKYMIDMWLDQPTQKLIASATTVWKESKRQIEEGKDFSNLSTSDMPNDRYSRAMIYNYKEYKTEDSDPVNYSKLILRVDTQKEGDDFYGDIRLKDFGVSDWMTNGDAISLCQRYIQRFSEVPRQLSFEMEERKLASTTIGDVVNVMSRDSQTADGIYLTSSNRIQITRVQPILNTIGRRYKVTGLSYVPLITSDGTGEYYVSISGTIFDVNLFAEAGRPNLPVNVTFILSNAVIGSNSSDSYSMDARDFKAGSRIRFILTNGSRLSAIGGAGGSAYTKAIGGSSPQEVATTSSGSNGGAIYNSNGIETEFYINYPAIEGYTASGSLTASSGGGASSSAATTAILSSGERVYVDAATATSGGGGAGIPGGQPGSAQAIDSGRDEAEGEQLIGGVGSEFVGGTGVSAEAISTYTRIVNNDGDRRNYTSTSMSTSGAGGSSGSSGDTASAFSLKESNRIGYVSESGTGVISVSNEGLAGYSFVGGNVTIYNTDPSKFIDGRNNGSGYTLIES